MCDDEMRMFEQAQKFQQKGRGVLSFFLFSSFLPKALAVSRGGSSSQRWNAIWKKKKKKDEIERKKMIMCAQLENRTSCIVKVVFVFFLSLFVIAIELCIVDSTSDNNKGRLRKISPEMSLKKNKECRQMVDWHARSIYCPYWIFIVCLARMIRCSSWRRKSFLTNNKELK